MIRIFVHLGLQSNQSAAFHRFMTAHRERLLAAGVLYPRTGALPQKFGVDCVDDHSGLVPAFRPAPLQSVGQYFRKSLLEEILTSNVHTVVLSSELLFHPASGAQAGLVKRLLSSVGEVRPVVYLNRQDRYAESEYVEAVYSPSSSLTSGIASFARALVRNGSLDYRARLQPWITTFGSSLVVRCLDDRGEIGFLTTDLLGSVVGIGDVVEPLANGTTDERDPGWVHVAQALNAVEGLSDAAKSDAFDSIRHEATDIATDGARYGPLVSDDLWLELASRYRDDNAWLAAQVVTGLAENLIYPAQRKAGSSRHRCTLRTARALVERWVAAAEVTPARGEAAAGARRDSCLPAPPRIGLTAVIRASLEHVQNWINYHFSIGFDEIVIFVDGPPFSPALRTLGNVTVVDCDEDFWRSMFVLSPQVLSEKTVPMRKLGQKILEAKGMDWIVGIDSDELVFGDLRSELAALPDSVDVLKLMPAESVQHAGMERVEGFESRVFKRRPGYGSAEFEIVANEYASIAPYSKMGFFGHVEGKSVVRAGTDADFWGNHRAVNTRQPLEQRTASDCIVLHFENRPFERWQERWRHKLMLLSDENIFSRERQNMFEFLGELFALDDEDAARSLYDSWYYMEDERIDRLESLGLVSRLHIPTAWFSGSTPDDGGFSQSGDRPNLADDG